MIGPRWIIFHSDDVTKIITDQKHWCRSKIGSYQIPEKTLNVVSKIFDCDELWTFWRSKIENHGVIEEISRRIRWGKEKSRDTKTQHTYELKEIVILDIYLIRFHFVQRRDSHSLKLQKHKALHYSRTTLHDKTSTISDVLVTKNRIE